MPEIPDEQFSASVTGDSTNSERPHSAHRARWEYRALVGGLLLAAFLRFWRLDQQGFGNRYYAAAVRSMLVDPSNFFFGAFDPAGLVSVDKPPGALWVQTLSAKIFGYYGVALLAPQALMGVLTVGLVYLQIRRVFGVPHALMAALVLAVNPISIAVERDNLPDPLLTLLMTLAAGALIRSAASASGKWLLTSFAIVGAAFNVKMLAAFVVLPTFFLVYLLTAPAAWFRKIGQLTAATVLLATVSLSWSIVVDLTPKNSRPFVGGSQNNSALSLALGYNGLGRIFEDQRPRPGKSSQQQSDDAESPRPARSALATTPSVPGISGMRGVHESTRRPFGGPPRAWRFVGATLSEQITWLFPLVVFGTWEGLLSCGWRRPINAKTIATLVWTGWLLTHLIVFSFARGIFHAYYTVVMGPAVAALVGIGIPALWRAALSSGWRRHLLPTAFLATAAWQAILIGRKHVELRYQLLPFVFGGLCLGAVLLVSTGTWRRTRLHIAWKFRGAVVGCAAALIGPALWSLSTTMNVSSSQLPTASAAWLTGDQRDVFLTPPEIDPSWNCVSTLVNYLRSEWDGESYLVAGLYSMHVQSIIIESGDTAVAIGGFKADDAVFTKEQFVSLVEHGKLRFMLLGGLGPGGMPFRGLMGGENSEIVAWVKEHGAKVDRELWESPALSLASREFSSSDLIAGAEFEELELYDLSATAKPSAKALNASTTRAHDH